jgi:LysM repeat protein
VAAPTNTGGPKPKAPKTGSVKVKTGNTLTSIAKKYHTTVGRIMKANKGAIKDANVIYAGQHIKVPGAAKKPKAAAPPKAQPQLPAILRSPFT